MLSERITVVIPTKNEQVRLPLAIKNFLGRLPVLISDNHSTDGTLEIAAAAGIPAITLDHPGYYENDQVMPILWAAIQTEYIIIAGCAEYFPLVLLERLAEIANSGSHDVVYIKRYSVSYGQLIPLSASPEVWQRGELRMYRRGCVDFSDTVIHGSGGRAIVAQDRQFTLGQDMATAILQFRDYDSSHNELQNNRYNNLWAQQRFERGERFSVIGMLLDCSIAFGSCYVRHGAWRHGVAGLIIGLQRGIMAFQVSCRIWEIEGDFLKASLIARHATLRQEVLVAQKGKSRLGLMMERMYGDSLLDYRGLTVLLLVMAMLPCVYSGQDASYLWSVPIFVGFSLIGYRRIVVTPPFAWQSCVLFLASMMVFYLRGGESTLATGLMTVVTLIAVAWLSPLLQLAHVRVFVIVVVGISTAVVSLLPLVVLSPFPIQVANTYVAIASVVLMSSIKPWARSSKWFCVRLIGLLLIVVGLFSACFLLFQVAPMSVFNMSIFMVGVVLFGSLLKWDPITRGALAGIIVIILFPGTWLGAIPFCGLLAPLLIFSNKKR